MARVLVGQVAAVSAFGVALLVLLARVYFSFTATDSARFTLVYFFGILLVGYGLFILEGLVISALRLRAADQEKLRTYLIDQRQEGLVDDLLPIAAIMKSDYDRFVVGRGLRPETANFGPPTHTLLALPSPHCRAIVLLPAV